MTPRPEPIDPNTDDARRFHDTVDAREPSAPGYVLADPAAFSYLDLAWYDRVRRVFEGYGFRHLGDVGEAAISARSSAEWRPTFARVLVSRDGTVTTTLYDQRLRSLVRRMLGWVRRASPRPVVHCETECTDGSLVETSNRQEPNGAPVASLVDVAYLPSRTRPEDVYAMHTARVTAHLKARPGVRAVVIRTRDELRQSRERHRALIASYQPPPL